MNVGVLALQGDVPEHRMAIRSAVRKARITLVRQAADLAGLNALVLPGGESTTIADLLQRSGLWNPLAEQLKKGIPTLATCAGLILLATGITPSPMVRDPPTFGALDVTVRRNDYGRQGESFEAPIRVAGIRGRPFPGVFIRAPRIVIPGSGVVPVAWRGEEVVGVRQGPIVGLAFHPELSGDPRLFRAFLTGKLGPHKRPAK
jgi:5'-phosphate synthase pdxT subunit